METIILRDRCGSAVVKASALHSVNLGLIPIPVTTKPENNMHKVFTWHSATKVA